jgi:hypothetical protein
MWDLLELWERVEGKGNSGLPSGMTAKKAKAEADPSLRSG